jgi:hypothetical protein
MEMREERKDRVMGDRACRYMYIAIEWKGPTIDVTWREDIRVKLLATEMRKDRVMGDRACQYMYIAIEWKGPQSTLRGERIFGCTTGPSTLCRSKYDVVR